MTSGDMATIVNIVFWIVRGIVLFTGGIPAVVKIVQGRAYDDKREFNGGLVTLGIMAVIIIATFAIEPIFTQYIGSSSTGGTTV